MILGIFSLWKILLDSGGSSQVLANFITLQKINRTNGFPEVLVKFRKEETYLNKDLIKSVLFSGMGDPKEYFIGKNNENFVKKNGYFLFFYGHEREE